MSHYIVPRTIECRFQQRCRKYKNVSNDQLWLFFNNTIISYVLNRFPITTYSVQHTEEIRSIKSQTAWSNQNIPSSFLAVWNKRSSVIERCTIWHGSYGRSFLKPVNFIALRPKWPNADAIIFDRKLRLLNVYHRTILARFISFWRTLIYKWKRK